MKPKIIITSGDPAGIGPYQIVQAISNLEESKYDFTIIGDRCIFEPLAGFERIRPGVEFINLDNTKGRIAKNASKYSGKAALEYIREATRILKNDTKAALVTAPLSKEAVRKNMPDFSGHTEFLAGQFSVKKFAMMMVGEKIKTVFLTRHILIRDIPKHLNLKNIYTTFKLSADALKYLFGIKQPRIGVCSLNPHAGVETYLADEDILLKEAIDKINSDVDDTKFAGPYPSDTLFRSLLYEEYDLVIAVYHDQGMIPFKSIEFSHGVNLTIGLPFIRTSPAHGPAFNLSGQPGLIDVNPMAAAIKLAARLQFK